MTADKFKEMLKQAAADLDADASKPVRQAISEIIRIERNYFYSPKLASNGRLREIRDIVAKYSALEGASDDNKLD